MPRKKQKEETPSKPSRPPVVTDEEQFILDLLKSCEQEYGEGAVMVLGGKLAVPRKVQTVIPTGSLALDKAVGIGGYPGGRVTEIFGAESSGKTTLALHAIANAQRQGRLAAFIDAEHALDVGYAAALGIDMARLVLSQPDSGERAMEITETLIRSNRFGVVVVDSVAALVPQAELEGAMTDMQPGMQARLMSKALRKLTAATHASDCVLIFINQIRMKIGISFGNPETTSGGKALRFFATMRLDMRRIGGLKEAGAQDGEADIGNRVRVTVAKNKLAPPFRKAEFDLIFGRGIDMTGEIVDLAVAQGIVKKAGVWYSYGDTNLAQGRKRTVNLLNDQPEKRDEILGKLTL